MSTDFEKIAREIVNEWDFDCHAVFSSLDAVSKRDMLIESVSIALKAEREAASRVALPSLDEFSSWLLQFKIEHKYSATSLHCYEWIKSNLDNK